MQSHATVQPEPESDPELDTSPLRPTYEEPASSEFAAERGVYGPDRRGPVRRALALTVLVLLLVALAAGLGIAFVVDPKPARADAGEAVAAPKDTSAVNPLAATGKAKAELPRKRTRVLVLNGLGEAGAAQSAAARLEARRYVVVSAGNAPFMGYRRTMVLYRKGFRGEAERLARDVGLGPRRVAPLDGMKRADLKGAHVVVILGG